MKQATTHNTGQGEEQITSLRTTTLGSPVVPWPRKWWAKEVIEESDKGTHAGLQGDPGGTAGVCRMVGKVRTVRRMHTHRSQVGKVSCTHSLLSCWP